MRTWYGVWFFIANLDWYFFLDTAEMYAIPCYIGYNGTPLYSLHNHAILSCPLYNDVEPIPSILYSPRPHFYQTRSAWSKDQGSNENHSPVHNFAPTVTKFCVMWEGQALPQDTKFGNCRDKIVDSRAFLSWSLILGLSWSGLIKLGPSLIFQRSSVAILPGQNITASPHSYL